MDEGSHGRTNSSRASCVELRRGLDSRLALAHRRDRPGPEHLCRPPRRRRGWPSRAARQRVEARREERADRVGDGQRRPGLEARRRRPRRSSRPRSSRRRTYSSANNGLPSARSRITLPDPRRERRCRGGPRRTPRSPSSDERCQGRSACVAATGQRRPSRAASSSGRVVPMTSSGTCVADASRDAATNASRASSAQWRSSRTTTAGPSPRGPRRNAPPCRERPPRGSVPTALSIPRSGSSPVAEPVAFGARPAGRRPSFAVADAGSSPSRIPAWRLDDLPERPERDAVAVGEATALAPGQARMRGLGMTRGARRRTGSCRSRARR